MKNMLLIAVAMILIVVAGLWITTGKNAKPENAGLPPSLDRYYSSMPSEPPKPPEFLIKMSELGESMQGIVVNIQQGDMGNATNSFRAFSQQYEELSRFVPEWRGYFRPKAVKELGESLEDASKDPSKIPGVFEAMGKVGETCHNCHVDNMVPVWNKYNWKDFSTVNISTPYGDMKWADAKMKFLDVGLVGIFVNAKKWNQTGAKESFQVFNATFDGLAKACLSCHSTEPRYYVSKDIRAMIDLAGAKIDAGNLTEAAGIIQGVGMESCYRCHVLHVPAQFSKVSRR